MSSQLEKLAEGIIAIGRSSGPAQASIEDLRRRCERTAPQVPNDEANRARGIRADLYAASEAIKEALSALEEFGKTADAFAARLVVGGSGGGPSASARSGEGAPSPDPRSAQSKARARAAANVWPGRQSYGNCGVQSARQLIMQATGVALGEDALLAESIREGNAREGRKPVERGGTAPADRKRILARHHVDSAVQQTTQAGLADAIADGRGVAVSVDAGLLWNDKNYLGYGHVVIVTDGDFTSNGDLSHVRINDTGTGKCGQRMPIADFMRAVNGYRRGSYMNVTKSRIWPTL